MGSACVRPDNDTHVCRMRINNGHGYHKCRKPGTIWFHDYDRENGRDHIGRSYIVCEDHAKDIRSYIGYLHLMEQTLDDYITYNVVYKVMHT